MEIGELVSIFFALKKRTEPSLIKETNFVFRKRDEIQAKGHRHLKEQCHYIKH